MIESRHCFILVVEELLDLSEQRVYGVQASLLRVALFVRLLSFFYIVFTSARAIRRPGIVAVPN